MPLTTSLPRLHRTVAERNPSRQALLTPGRAGAATPVGWADYRQRADVAAGQLIELGVQPGDRVAIVSANSIAWLIADLAILSAGAVTVAIAADSSVERTGQLLQDCGACGIYVDSITRLDRLEQLVRNASSVQFVISLEPDASATVIRGGAIVVRPLQAGDLSPEMRRIVMQREGRIHAADLATICYTSGTMDAAKGVALTHGNLLSNVEGIRQSSGITRDDVILNGLPLHHLLARTCEHYLSIRAAATLCVTDSLRTAMSLLPSVEPTRFAAVPRVFASVWNQVKELPPVERTIRLREIFGRRARHLSSGGAPLPCEVLRGFWGAGMPLVEGYGLTEAGPVLTYSRPGRHRIGTVGQALRNVRLRIQPLAAHGCPVEQATVGEILAAGPNIMRGYWNNPGTTQEVLRDGWLRTGDLGSIDQDGYLTVLGRLDDLIVMQNGKKVHARAISRGLEQLPGVDHAVVDGQGQDCLVALVVPSSSVLASLHARTSPPDSDAQDEFITDEQTREHYRQQIAAFSSTVDPHERVRAFLLLGRSLDPARGELTAKGEPSRKQLLAAFRAPLDALHRQLLSSAVEFAPLKDEGP